MDNHTPLKRARLPIPPCPQRLINYNYSLPLIQEKIIIFLVDKRIYLTTIDVNVNNVDKISVNVYLKRSGRYISLRTSFGCMELYVFRDTSYKQMQELISKAIKKNYNSKNMTKPFYKENVYIYVFGVKKYFTNDIKFKDDPSYFYVSKKCKDPLTIYKKLFLEYVSSRSIELGKKMNLNLSDFTFRTGLFLSYFGVCFPTKKQIKFDYRLFSFKQEVIDSVIYHELTHLFVLPHNDSFYKILYSYCPKYEEYTDLLNSGYFTGRDSYYDI